MFTKGACMTLLTKIIFLVLGLSCCWAAASFDSIPALKPIPAGDGITRPLYVPIWSPLYELNGNSIYPGSPYVQTTLYEPYNDFTHGWWDNILEEFAYAGINTSLILTRAWIPETRQWDTLKTNLIPALKRAGDEGYMKFGQFEDCGSWKGAFKKLTNHDTIDWADTTTMVYIMWDLCVKQFFDFMPSDLVLRYNGKALWAGWYSGGINTQGNISRVLREVKKRFKATYKQDIFIIIDNSWRKGDSTITVAEADGVQNWFCCGNAGTFFTWNNVNVGACVPGFGIFDSVGTPKAHGASFDRDHGQRLKQFLDSSVSVKANIVIEEGYVDMRESAGIYRSPKWDFPSQYLEIVREFTDQITASRRFQAEACDSFYNKTISNTSVIYSSRKLDVSTLLAPNYGWFVDGTDAGDWLKWKQAFFSAGTYDAYLRYAATTADNRIVLSFAGKNDTVALPSTSGVFQGKKIITARPITSGKQDITMTFLTAGLQVDFMQINKAGLAAVEKPFSILKDNGFSAKVAQVNGVLRIMISVPIDNARIEMRLFDSHGRLMRSFAQSGINCGPFTAQWATIGIAGGSYILKISVIDKSGFVRSTNTVTAPIFAKQ